MAEVVRRFSEDSILFVGGAGLRGRVGGNSLFVAFIDSESVAIAILWRLLTAIVGVNSLGQSIIVNTE